MKSESEKANLNQLSSNKKTWKIIQIEKIAAEKFFNAFYIRDIARRVTRSSNWSGATLIKPTSLLMSIIIIINAKLIE